MEKNYNTLTGNFFTFRNQKCDCKIEITYNQNGNKIIYFKMAAIPDKYCTYAYQAKDGLIMFSTEANESPAQIHPIEDLMKLNSENEEALKEYFLNYGFFFPLSNSYGSYHFKALHNAILHFKITVELTSLLEEKSIDYHQLLTKILMLNFCEPATIRPLYDSSEHNSIYTTCKHPFHDSWNVLNPAMLTSIPDSQKYYEVSDSLTNKTENISREEYAKLITPLFKKKGKGLPISAFDQVNFLYFTKQKHELSKNIIDLLYHINKDICQIKEIAENGEITFMKETALVQSPEFTQQYKDLIKIIARKTIKEEIDFATMNIHPAYNITTLEPDWEIANLYSALYFSIFYTRPSFDIYRKCKNELCNEYFRVQSTNSKKIYHCQSCQEAAAQKRFRKKKQLQ